MSALTRKMTIILVLVALLLAPAWAGYTNIFSSPSGEKKQAQILSHIYGGSFISSGKNFIGTGDSTGILAQRVKDYGAESPMNTVSGGAGNNDQIWTDGIAVTTAEARFAGYSQAFGYDSGSGYVKLFDVTGSGFSVSGMDTWSFGQGTTWQWVKSGTGGKWYSGSNIDSQDHMITYKIVGLGDNSTTWVLFWEDAASSRRLEKNRDFDDLVVEVKAKALSNYAPVPSAILLGGIGIVVLGWLRKFSILR